MILSFYGILLFSGVNDDNVAIPATFDGHYVLTSSIVHNYYYSASLVDLFGCVLANNFDHIGSISNVNFSHYFLTKSYVLDSGCALNSVCSMIGDRIKSNINDFEVINVY